MPTAEQSQATHGVTIDTLARSLTGERLSADERANAADFLAALMQVVAGDPHIANRIEQALHGRRTGRARLEDAADR